MSTPAPLDEGGIPTDLHIYTDNDNDGNENLPDLDEVHGDNPPLPYSTPNQSPHISSASSLVSSTSNTSLNLASPTIQNMDSHFSILSSPSSQTSPNPDSPTTPSNITAPVSPTATPRSPQDFDMSTLRAGSVLGISLRAKMEFRASKRTKNKWKKGFFTFNEITCSMFLHSAPGKDPMDVYEISSCIEKPNRMFKRKNRIDVLCTDGELLSLSAPTPELKAQFMDKFSER